MNWKKLTKILSFFFVFISFWFIFPQNTLAKVVMINEFSPFSSSPWIEIINSDQNNSQSLSGWTVLNGAWGTFATLSGSLPRGGMLTF